MSINSINWKSKHVLKVNNQAVFCSDDDITEEQAYKHRTEIEPWLSAIFQSEHLSLLIGSGLTNAVCYAADIKPQQMNRLEIEHKYSEQIKTAAEKTSKLSERGMANFEDDIRSINELIAGLEITNDDSVSDLKLKLNDQLKVFIDSILKVEREFNASWTGEAGAENFQKAESALNLLKSFLLSFSSRTASRERLNLFTTNYDRFIELGADELGIMLLDRFKGKLKPIFRNTRLELDIHYNPPGIRGEPRYVEGVVRITKLHGSVDWRYENRKIIRSMLPFGAEINHPQIPKELRERVVIYPNSAKDFDTAFYPYAELFRDFSSAICRPNSILVTYGYGFGDSHINRVIADMLTIPSTHLVIIAYDYLDKKGSYGPVRERIKKFYDSIGNSAQFTILLGEHFGDIFNLVKYYLPKSAIDRLTNKKQEILERRGEAYQKPSVNLGDESSTQLNQ